jgi:hypothetical protein
MTKRVGIIGAGIAGLTKFLNERVAMELTQIKTFLDSPNPQNRMRAIVALRNHEPNENYAVPLNIYI